ncbi:type I-B CRISPR-associated protein Cas5b [Aneurinibacillus sp. REN35]|uniref:type I-B CRISPR-associated protein Cas5b n=1 Tax=Aneurinibacillus sp. REN35 TaxID=3237286 RepID=UPI003526FB04
MKVLRLKLFQETACYKKPHACKVSETYPLPPFSTVKGMLHAVMDARTLIPMKLCIQGEYDTIISDYQTHYFFKKDKTDEFALTADGLGITRKLADITTMPIYRHLLYHVHLTIFVQAEANILQQLQERICSSCHISLGRWEDLVRVDECEIVELTEVEDADLTLHAFVPAKFIRDSSYIPYRLNWTYRIVNGVRVWDKIEAGYVQKGSAIEADEGIWVDDEETAVFFHE